MVYPNLSIEELRNYPYPNLIAELIESGYSICTLGEHMGLNGRRSENDVEIWAKLRGEEDILSSEALGLARLFSVKLEYLFDNNLQTTGDGKSFAHTRWLDHNQEKEREYQEAKQRKFICEVLQERPYLFEVMKMLSSLDKEEIGPVIECLRKII